VITLGGFAGPAWRIPSNPRLVTGPRDGRVDLRRALGRLGEAPDGSIFIRYAVR
jgi:hypothetical protein